MDRNPWHKFLLAFLGEVNKNTQKNRDFSLFYFPAILLNEGKISLIHTQLRSHEHHFRWRLGNSALRCHRAIFILKSRPFFVLLLVFFPPSSGLFVSSYVISGGCAAVFLGWNSRGNTIRSDGTNWHFNRIKSAVRKVVCIKTLCISVETVIVYFPGDLINR